MPAGKMIGLPCESFILKEWQSPNGLFRGLFRLCLYFLIIWIFLPIHLERKFDNQILQSTSIFNNVCQVKAWKNVAYAVHEKSSIIWRRWICSDVNRNRWSKIFLDSRSLWRESQEISGSSNRASFSFTIFQLIEPSGTFFESLKFLAMSQSCLVVLHSLSATPWFFPPTLNFSWPTLHGVLQAPYPTLPFLAPVWHLCPASLQDFIADINLGVVGQLYSPVVAI